MGHQGMDSCGASCSYAGSLTPKDIFGGPDGAVAKIRALQAWFESQRSLLFFAASILVIYEVRPACPGPPALGPFT